MNDFSISRVFHPGALSRLAIRFSRRAHCVAISSTLWDAAEPRVRLAGGVAVRQTSRCTRRAVARR
jgi:hypothetical protein